MKRTGMREKVLALWELRSQLLRERRQPGFGLAITSVDCVEVLENYNRNRSIIWMALGK